MSAGTLSLILAIVVGAASIVGLYLATRGRSAKETLDMFPAINEELRAQIAFYQTEQVRKDAVHAEQRMRDREEFNQKLHEQDLACKAEISELRGQVRVLSGQLVDRIVTGVTDAVKKEFGQ